MKVAITVWNSRVSPVFDTATRVLLVDLENGKETGRVEVALTDAYPPLRIQRLRSRGVDLLICGAVSNAAAALVESAGIELIPWISGDTDEVLRAFADGKLMSARFVMPGCGRQLRRRHGRGTGRNVSARVRGRKRRGFEHHDAGRGMRMEERGEYSDEEVKE